TTLSYPLALHDALPICSGLSYTVNFDTEMGPYDQSYEVDGIRIIVDMKSAIYLQGTQLDYQKDLVSGQFKFSNPNAAKNCGCGEDRKSTRLNSSHQIIS